MIVRPARSRADLDVVALLMREFVAWHYERHSEDREIIDSYFDPAKFEEELGTGPEAAMIGCRLACSMLTKKTLVDLCSAELGKSQALQ